MWHFNVAIISFISKNIGVILYYTPWIYDYFVSIEELKLNVGIEISMVDNLNFSNTGFNVLGLAWLVSEMFPFSEILFGILKNLL